MSTNHDGLTIAESSIMGIVEDAEKQFSENAGIGVERDSVKAQYALVVVTGYQALALERIANILGDGTKAVHKLAAGFDKGTDSSKALVTAVEDLRKVISSNGFDHGPR